LRVKVNKRQFVTFGLKNTFYVSLSIFLRDWTEDFEGEKSGVFFHSFFWKKREKFNSKQSIIYSSHSLPPFRKGVRKRDALKGEREASLQRATEKREEREGENERKRERGSLSLSLSLSTERHAEKMEASDREAGKKRKEQKGRGRERRRKREEGRKGEKKRGRERKREK